MKKLMLMLAFAGMVGSVSAATVRTTGDGDKGKDKGKKECCKKGEEKACCKGKAEGKACSMDKKDGEKKACCKDKKSAAKPATNP